VSTRGSEQRVNILVTAGSVVSAIASSACCWLPLVLLAFGASAIGVATFFEKYRPLFLITAAGLLGAGFYFNYFRKEHCAAGSTCEVPRPRLKRFNRFMLWVATVFVLAFALFPTYVGRILGTPDDSRGASTKGQIETWVFQVEGMTCSGCEVTIETGHATFFL